MERKIVLSRVAHFVKLPPPILTWSRIISSQSVTSDFFGMRGKCKMGFYEAKRLFLPLSLSLSLSPFPPISYFSLHFLQSRIPVFNNMCHPGFKIAISHFCAVVEKPLLLEHWVGWLDRPLDLLGKRYHDYENDHMIWSPQKRKTLSKSWFCIYPNKLVLLLEPSNVGICRNDY